MTTMVRLLSVERFSYSAPGSSSSARCPSVCWSALRWVNRLSIRMANYTVHCVDILSGSTGGPGVWTSSYFPSGSVNGRRCKGTRWEERNVARCGDNEHVSVNSRHIDISNFLLLLFNSSSFLLPQESSSFYLASTHTLVWICGRGHTTCHRRRWVRGM